MAVEEGNVPVGSTGFFLDTTKVTQTDGTTAHREVVTVGDPETLVAYSAVKDTPPLGTDYGLVTRPVLNTDAFGRVRTSDPTTLFANQLQYDESDIVWNESLTGSGTFTHDANGAFGNMNTTTASGDEVIRQSPYLMYQPGKSQLILVTFDMVEALSNCRKRVGYFDGNNGIFLELDGSTVTMNLRSSVSGSIVDTSIAQASWNVDPMDGTGPSNVTLDLTKSQILFIDIEWLGVGVVRTGFVVDGLFCNVHTFMHANENNKTYMTTANLPVRYEITNTAGTASAGLLRQICCSVMSEGGFNEDIGYRFSAGNGTTTIGVTTRRAILSVRPKTTFNSITNRGLIIPQEFGVFAQTEAGYFEIVYNGTLGGSPSWASVNADSICEFDVAGTTVTGGITIAQGHADAGGAGLNAFGGTAAQSLAARYPLHLDIDGANPTIISLVATAHTATCNISGHIAWREIR